MTLTHDQRETNERIELGRYTISAGERIVYGQRILGVVRTSRQMGAAVAT